MKNKIQRFIIGLILSILVKSAYASIITIEVASESKAPSFDTITYQFNEKVDNFSIQNASFILLDESDWLLVNSSSSGYSNYTISKPIDKISFKINYKVMSDYYKESYTLTNGIKAIYIPSLSYQVNKKDVSPNKISINNSHLVLDESGNNPDYFNQYLFFNKSTFTSHKVYTEANISPKEIKVVTEKVNLLLPNFGFKNKNHPVLIISRSQSGYAGSATFSEIILSIPSNADQTDLQQLISHELSHFYLEKKFNFKGINQYSWLHEGIAEIYSLKKLSIKNGIRLESANTMMNSMLNRCLDHLFYSFNDMQSDSTNIDYNCGPVIVQILSQRGYLSKILTEHSAISDNKITVNYADVVKGIRNNNTLVNLINAIENNNYSDFENALISNLRILNIPYTSNDKGKYYIAGSILSHLMRLDCNGSIGFQFSKNSIVTDTINDCKNLSNKEIFSVEGIPIFEGQRNLELIIQDKCALSASLRLNKNIMMKCGKIYNPLPSLYNVEFFKI